MLKLIDSSLGADVLHALRSMGHGDELIIMSEEEVLGVVSDK